MQSARGFKKQKQDLKVRQCLQSARPKFTLQPVLNIRQCERTESADKENKEYLTSIIIETLDCDLQEQQGLDQDRNAHQTESIGSHNPKQG